MVSEVQAAELDREVATINLVDEDRVEIFYKDGGFRNMSLNKFIGKDGFLGKVLNDVGTKLGLPELNLSEKAGYLNKEQRIEEFNKRVGEIKDVVSQKVEEKPKIELASSEPTEKGESIIVKSGGKDQPVKEIEVPNEVSSVISKVFGDEAQDAASVLHHPYGEQVKGEGQGENAGFQVKDITILNEGYDTALSAKNKKILDGKGEDGKYHSWDRGLFRINSRTFEDFIRDKRPGYRDAMYEAGIIDDPYTDKPVTKAVIRKYWEQMDDPVKNTKMAKIIRDKRGWGQWYAAPAYLIKQNSEKI